jgi:hypothetical protein
MKKDLSLWVWFEQAMKIKDFIKKLKEFDEELQIFIVNYDCIYRPIEHVLEDIKLQTTESIKQEFQKFDMDLEDLLTTIDEGLPDKFVEIQVDIK